MQSFISGKLAGLQPAKVTIELPNKKLQELRRGFDYGVQWALENMGKPVMCLIEDGIVTEVKPLGEKDSHD